MASIKKSSKRSTKATGAEKAKETTESEVTDTPVDEPVEPQQDKTAPEPSPPAEEPAESVDDTPEAEIPAEEEIPTDEESAPVAATGHIAEEEPQPRRAGVLPLILGGAAAAVLGYGAAQFMPQGWPIAVPEDNTAELRAELSAQSDNIEALRAELASAGQSGDIAALTARADALEAETGQSLPRMQETIAALETRLGDLEKRPIAGEAASDAAVNAFQREVENLRARLDDIQTAAAEQAASVAKDAEAIKVEAALTRLHAALDSGAGFADALTDLGGAPGVLIPEALQQASGGVATQATLQDAFPDAARTALSAAADAAVEDGSMTRFGGFLRRQLGARSLSPREGGDADAVLSRAEAAVNSGDLAAALAEINTLDGAAQAAMSDWATQAETRRAALEAAGQLTAALAGN